MWSIDLQQTASIAQQNKNESLCTGLGEANNVNDVTLNRDIVQYLHRAAGSPVPSMWTNAIDKDNYAT